MWRGRSTRHSVPGRASAGMEIVFGHWSTLDTHDTPGVHHLDTGCVWGGALTALRLDGGQRERTSIPCAGACEPGDV